MPNIRSPRMIVLTSSVINPMYPNPPRVLFSGSERKSKTSCVCETLTPLNGQILKTNRWLSATLSQVPILCIGTWDSVALSIEM